MRIDRFKFFLCGCVNCGALAYQEVRGVAEFDLDQRKVRLEDFVDERCREVAFPSRSSGLSAFGLIFVFPHSRLLVSNSLVSGLSVCLVVGPVRFLSDSCIYS